MPERLSIRVVTHRRGRGDASRDRAAAVRAWLARQPREVIDELIAALLHSENAAGAKLQALGCPRTWRKNMRVV